MEATLQDFDDWPNWKITDRDLKELITRRDLNIEVRYQLVDTPDAATQLSFRMTNLSKDDPER